MNLAPIYHLCQHDALTEAFDRGDFLFPIPPAKRPYVSDVRPGLNFRSFEKTPITFWLSRAGHVELSVLKEGVGPENKQESESPVAKETSEQSIEYGKIEPAKNVELPKKLATAEKPIVSFELSGEKGLNQFRWNLVVKENRSSAPYFINYQEFLDVGRYRVRIETADKIVHEQSLEVGDDQTEN